MSESRIYNSTPFMLMVSIHHDKEIIEGWEDENAITCVVEHKGADVKLSLNKSSSGSVVEVDPEFGGFFMLSPDCWMDVSKTTVHCEKNYLTVIVELTGFPDKSSIQYYRVCNKEKIYGSINCIIGMANGDCTTTEDLKKRIIYSQAEPWPVTWRSRDGIQAYYGGRVCPFCKCQSCNSKCELKSAIESGNTLWLKSVLNGEYTFIN